jgi:hypothetical protein
LLHSVKQTGPIPIPILGNAIQIARAAKKPHLAFSAFAKQYGEVFSIKLGRHDYGNRNEFTSITDYRL